MFISGFDCFKVEFLCYLITGSDNTIAIIVACVVGFVALLAVIVGLIFWRRSNGKYLFF